MKISIPCDILYSALHFAAQKDIRSYLNGVTIDLSGEKEIIVYASNGVVIGCYLVRVENHEPIDLQFVIPYHFLKEAKAGGVMVFEFDPNTIGDNQIYLDVNVEYLSEKLVKTAIQCEKSKLRWRNIFHENVRKISSEENFKFVFFDPNEVKKFYDCQKPLNKNKKNKTSEIRIRPTGGDNDPAVVTLYNYNDFIGLIMPKKQYDVIKFTKVPEWV